MLTGLVSFVLSVIASITESITILVKFTVFVYRIVRIHISFHQFLPNRQIRQKQEQQHTCTLILN